MKSNFPKILQEMPHLIINNKIAKKLYKLLDNRLFQVLDKE